MRAAPARACSFTPQLLITGYRRVSFKLPLVFEAITINAEQSEPDNSSQLSPSLDGRPSCNQNQCYASIGTKPY